MAAAAAQPTAAVGPAVPHIDGYRVVGRLGEGGMGVVWRAVQLSAQRAVALKVLHPGAVGSQHARLRFGREVRLTSRLEHRNIARLYDSGLWRGACYYTMELVDGLPLDVYVRRNQASTAQIVAIVARACRAVQHAHERGVMHRDLKPSNILVTDEGEPHVLDFGLAKALEAAGQPEGGLMLSREGAITGTPAYMAPEQAAGHTSEVGVRTDVYTLGVILFELLTGELPYDTGGSAVAIITRIVEEDIRRPREVTKSVDRELEAILLKAMARASEARYASAGELAKDLENYLNGEPLSVRPAGTVAATRRFVRRHALPVSIVLVAAIVLGARAGALLQPLELSAYDAMIALRLPRKAPEPPVSIVGITEGDIRRLNYYPIKDRDLVDLLEKLTAMGARAIGVDIYRDIEEPPGREELNRALATIPGVVAVMQFGVADARIPPPRVLEGTERVGFSDQVVDRDGVIRRGLLFMDDGETICYSLSLRLALAYLAQEEIVPGRDPANPEHLRLGEVTVRPFESTDGAYVNADAGGYQFLMDYRRRGGFPVYSFTDVAEGEVDGEVFRDRVVLVGVTAESIKDYVSIPGRPRIRGVQMQATCVDQLLRMALLGHRPMGVLPDWLESLSIVGLIVLGGVASSVTRSKGMFLAVSGGGVLAIALAAYVAFCLGLWVPLAPPALGWLAAGLMAAPHRRHRRRSG